MERLQQNSEQPKTLRAQLAEKYPGMSEEFAAVREFENVNQMREWYAEYLGEVQEDRIKREAEIADENPQESPSHRMQHEGASAEEDALEYIMQAIYHSPLPNWEEWYKAIPALEKYRKARTTGSLEIYRKATAEDVEEGGER